MDVVKRGEREVEGCVDCDEELCRPGCRVFFSKKGDVDVFCVMSGRRLGVFAPS